MDHLERAQRLCLALPEAFEKTAWGAPTFRVHKRMFASYANDHHGDGNIGLWVNAPAGQQQVLVQSEPESFFVPPYVGVKGWVGIRMDRVDDERITELLTQAWRMVAPKRLRQELEEDE